MTEVSYHRYYCLLAFSDTGTVDYDTTMQTRHLFRLAAMTEVPISVEDWEKAQQEMEDKS